MKKRRIKLDGLLEVREFNEAEINFYIDTRVNKIVHHTDKAHNSSSEEIKLKRGVKNTQTDLSLFKNRSQVTNISVWQTLQHH